MFLSWVDDEEQVVAEEIHQVYLELSTFCSLSCKTCERNSVVDFEQQYMDATVFDHVMASIHEISTLERVVLLGYGVALCHPQIEYLLERLVHAVPQLVLVTNGHLLTDTLISRFVSLPAHEIFISCDELTDNSPSIRHGSDINLLKANIQKLQQAKTDNKYPVIGMEIVAQKRNFNSLPELVLFGQKIGVEKCIVTNLFPYREDMKKDILFDLHGPIEHDFLKVLADASFGNSIILAEQVGDLARCCPFVEKGTMFLNVHGEVTPCIELAHTHSAFYFSICRNHVKFILGDIQQKSLTEIWQSEIFTDFRAKFRYFEFPDCSACFDPDMCYTRTLEKGDCCFNDTPCGECLWAKNIIICP